MKRYDNYKIEFTYVKIIGFMLMLAFYSAMGNSIEGMGWLAWIIFISIILSFLAVHQDANGDVSPNTKHSLYTSLTLVLATLVSMFTGSKADGKEWVSSGALNPIEYEGYATTYKQYMDFSITFSDVVLIVITLTTILFLVLWNYGRIVVFVERPDEF